MWGGSCVRWELHEPAIENAIENELENELEPPLKRHFPLPNLPMIASHPS